LAHGPSITGESLHESLKKDKQLGYGGMVLVPALIDTLTSLPPTKVAGIFKDVEMTALVCGFNPGHGPDPLEEDESALCLKNIRATAEYAIVLAEQGCGPRIMVGPLHTLHGKMRSAWPADGFRRWMDKLHALAVELDLMILFEPLNVMEDATPDPFHTLYGAVWNREQFGMHWDTGHAHSHGLGPTDFAGMVSKVHYLEFANFGRWPLDRETFGIDFRGYAEAMVNLPADCLVGAEPFDRSVIKAFKLESLCTTNVSGPDCLRRDAAYLRSIGVMA